jgi:hypothetical protein
MRSSSGTVDGLHATCNVGRHQDARPRPRRARFADDKRYAIRINDEFTVDVMPSIAGLSWEEMQPHITSMSIDGVNVRLIDLPGLLKTKQGARPKDQMDAAVIAAALEKLRKSG